MVATPELGSVAVRFSAGMVKGMDTVDSVRKAVKFLSKGIHDAVLEGTDRNEGICFERYLSELAAEN